MESSAAYYIGLWTYRCIALIGFFIFAYMNHDYFGLATLLAVIVSLTIKK